MALDEVEAVGLQIRRQLLEGSRDRLQGMDLGLPTRANCGPHNPEADVDSYVDNGVSPSDESPRQAHFRLPNVAIREGIANDVVAEVEWQEHSRLELEPRRPSFHERTKASQDHALAPRKGPVIQDVSHELHVERLPGGRLGENRDARSLLQASHVRLLHQ